MGDQATAEWADAGLEPYYLGMALLWLGHLDEAERVFEQLGKNDPRILVRLADIAVLRGDTRRAGELARALDDLRLTEDRWAGFQAEVAAVRGERQRAVALLRQVSATPYWVHRYTSFRSLWDYPPFQEFLRPKG